MNIDKFLKLYEEGYKATGTTEDLSVALFIKESTSGEEVFTGELIVYNEFSPEVNSIEQLFKTTKTLGTFLLNFINIDTMLLEQLLHELESIIVYDNITVKHVFDNIVKTAKDMDLHNISFETVDNTRISNTAGAIMRKLFKIHPYMLCFFDTFAKIKLFPASENVVPDLGVTAKELKHIIELINECRNVVDFTFLPQKNYPELEQYDGMTRYYIYTEYAMQPKSRFSNLPRKSFEFIYTSPIQRIKENAPLKEIITAYKGIQMHYDSISYLDVHYGSNTCAESIINLIQKGKKIQKCALCGKYYFLKGKHKSYYCNNLYENTKKTCQQVAASNNHKDRKNSNPILREYDRAYKRNYARVSNNKINREEFRKWVDESTLKRDDAAKQYESNPSDQIINDFKKYLGNK